MSKKTRRVESARDPGKNAPDETAGIPCECQSCRAAGLLSAVSSFAMNWRYCPVCGNRLIAAGTA